MPRRDGLRERRWDVRVRTVLLLAFLVVVAALAVLGGWSAWWLHGLGGASRRIIADNYASVVAAQRMKESLERLDSAALFRLLGRDDRARAQAAEHRGRFEASFQRAAANVTEPGESALVGRIRTERADYLAHLEAFMSAAPAAPDAYFTALEPRFDRLRGELDRLLALNQDAMQAKSRAAEAVARRYVWQAFVLAGVLVVGSTVVAAQLSRRLVEPLAALTATADRLSSGALETVAPEVDSPREVRDLARSFNRMQTRLRELRQSDLGRLRAAQQLSDAAIDSLYDPVIVTDVEGRLTRVNRAATDVFGSDTAMVGRPADDIGAGTEIGAAVRQVIASGQPAGGDAAGVTRLSTSAGDRDYRVRATPLRDDAGTVMGSVTLLEDVTHLREVDRDEVGLDAVASHELRTPLTAVRMALPLLIEPGAEPLTVRQRRLVDLYQHHVDRLQHLMAELLDVGRLESGRASPVLADVGVAPLVAAVVESMGAAASRRGVVLRTTVAAGLPALRADRSQLERVLVNLVDNALKATPGGGTVTLAAEPQADHVALSVRDTGRGIAADDLPRLFERFSRAPDAPDGGAGLGLFIARRIVEAHGGRIWALSEPGRGALFSFTIPSVPSGPDSRVVPA